jgi:protein-tyrosine-phosphatase
VELQETPSETVDGIDPGHCRARVLFVCYGNSFRSQIAEAFAHHHGMGYLQAFSAGMNASAQVSRRARRTMGERGVPLPLGVKTKGLSKFDLSSFDLIVNLTRLSLPATDAPSIQIETPDVRGADDEAIRDIRDELEESVLNIISALGPAPSFRPILLYRGAASHLG